MRGLDAWIMGLNDPYAPFNQSDDELEFRYVNTGEVFTCEGVQYKKISAREAVYINEDDEEAIRNFDPDEYIDEIL